MEQKKKKTRAEILKTSRVKHNLRNFSVMIEATKIEKLTKKLEKQAKSKTQWVNEKIDEELKKDWYIRYLGRFMYQFQYKITLQVYF